MTHEHGPNCNHDHDETPSLAMQVKEIVSRCLYTDEEVKHLNREAGEHPEGIVLVEGIMRNFGFHPERLMNEAEPIRQILRQVVTDDFKTPDGATFLHLCQDRAGNLWAEHPTMEELCCLAMGLKWCKCVMPRVFWAVLPGGVPYYSFDFEKPPVLKYEHKINKEPNPEHQRRFDLWMRIHGLGKNPASILMQEMWERLEVPPAKVREMTPEERAWVLANAGIEADNTTVRAALERFEVDPKLVFPD
jgi:hypothetical protein